MNHNESVVFEKDNILIKTPESLEEVYIAEDLFGEGFAENIRLVILDYPKELLEQSFITTREYDTVNKSRYMIIDKDNGKVCGVFRI